MPIPTMYDRVKETAQSPGTGAVPLLGAQIGFRRFGDVLANGATTYYVLSDQSGANWELGTATWNTGHTLTRTAGQVLAGSAGAGALTNFASGVQDVYLPLPAEAANLIATALQAANNLSDLTNPATARANLGGVLIGTGGGSASADPTAWSGTVLDFDADDIAGADGAAVSSWTPRRDTGTIGNLTQGTGGNQPSLKTGGNGINNHNVVRFNGTHFLATAAFGAKITGDYYSASIWKVNTSIGAGLSEVLWKFGDAAPANGKGRSLYQNGLSSTTFSVAYNTVGGINTFFPNSLTVTQGTVLLIEVIQRGARVTVYVNGAPVLARASKDFSAFTNGVLRLGYANFTLSADVARFTLTGTIPTAAQRGAYRQYLAARYGVTLSIDGGYARYTGAAVVDETEAASQSGSLSYLAHLILGGAVQAQTGGATDGSFNQDATLTCWGPAAFLQEGGEYRFENAWSLFNTMSVRNKASDGYGVIRFLHYSSGKEMRAIGLCPPNIFPFGGPNSSSFDEFSNFNDLTKYGDRRGVQTKNGSSLLRDRWRDDTLAFEIYDETAAEPSVSGPTTGLVTLAGRPKSSVANNGTLNTTITTGATQGGLIVVKDATSSRIGVFRLDNTTLTAISADAIYSTTSGTAGKINVYNSSGQIQLENKTGGALNLTAAYYGA